MYLQKFGIVESFRSYLKDTCNCLEINLVITVTLLYPVCYLDNQVNFVSHSYIFLKLVCSPQQSVRQLVGTRFAISMFQPAVPHKL